MGSRIFSRNLSRGRSWRRPHIVAVLVQTSPVGSDDPHDRGDDASGLVARALAGEARAFEDLVRAHRALVLSRLLADARDMADAEDMAQEVFVRAYRSLGRLRDPGSVAGWLLGIARHVAADSRRRRPPAAFPLAGDEIDRAALERGPDREGRGEELRGALASLPERYRRAIVLRHMDGLDYDALAARLGISPAGARQRVKRGLDRLRGILGPRFQEERP